MRKGWKDGTKLTFRLPEDLQVYHIIMYRVAARVLYRAVASIMCRVAARVLYRLATKITLCSGGDCDDQGEEAPAIPEKG